MRRSLRRPKVNVNFFFFQDIITAALGVILFIALILALRIEQASDVPAAPVTPDQIAAEKHLNELLEQLVSKRQLLQSLNLNSSIADPNALAKQIEMLRAQKAALTASIAAKDAPIQGANNSREIDEALQGGKTELAKAQAESTKITEQLNAVQAQVAELEAQIKDLESKLLSEEQLKNRIWLIPQASGTSKEPLLITVNSSGYEMQRYGKKDQKKSISGGNIPDLLRTELKNFPKSDFYVVLYVKPSAFPLFESIRSVVTSEGYEVGTDVITEDTVLDFSPPQQ